MDLPLPALEYLAVKHLADDGADLEACFRLRYLYFVEQRGWVEASDEALGLEQDGYDRHALHLAVSDESGVAAYLRLLPFAPNVGFMLDRELSCILSEAERQSLPRENSAEVSRLVVRPGVGLCASNRAHPLELLFRRFYQESRARGFARFYIVVEEGWLRLFARRFGLAFQVIGAPYVFPDGTRTVAATATMEELEDGMRRHSAAKLAWYAQDE